MHRRDFLRLLSAAPLSPALRSLPFRQDVEPDVEFTLTARADDVGILDGAPTRVWRFTGALAKGPETTLQTLPGSYLGPVIRLRRGQRVRVHFRNRLDEPSIVHWHGLDVPESADGHPRLAVDGGRDYTYDFEVTNRAGTYWYHPHPHMRTGPQVYQGLAGLLLVGDPEEDALELPSAEAELLCVIQDRRFDARNQLVYLDGGPPSGRGGMGRGGMGMGMGRGNMAAMMQTMNGWLGDQVLVNGRHRPTIAVNRQTYRLRLLNGSNARIYKLGWSDRSPMTVIGSDGGLLERAHTMTTLTLAPAQRADVLLDLSDRPPGSLLELRSLAYPVDAVGQVGMMGGVAPLPQGAAIELLTLKVSSEVGARHRLPDRLSAPLPGWTLAPEAPVRRVPLTYRQMRWTIDGREFDMNATEADETVQAGSTHIWEFVNGANPMGMMMAHPIHLHGRQFRVISRSGAETNPLSEGLNDAGLTDTVLVRPNETVRVQVTFSQHPGLYLYHCHILEHEDMGMMRNFRIER